VAVRAAGWTQSGPSRLPGLRPFRGTLCSVRWDSLQDLVTWHDRLRRSAGEASGWTPPVDVYETADHYIIVVELSGLSSTDFDVQATDEQITVKGIRAGDAGDGRFIHVERAHGAFSRSFSFPQRLDVRRITADFRDGLLTVTVPKQPKPTPHRVDLAE
jgi:HSP20 family protein